MQKKLVFLSLLLMCGSLCAEDVFVFRGNARHTGVYEATGVPRFNTVKWKFHTNGMVIGSPVIAGRVVYVGSTDGNLYAIDEASGAQKWKYAVKSRIPSTPTIEAGTVYFTAYDGNLYSVDAASGALKWKFQTAGERRFSGKHLHGTQPVAEIMPDPFDCYLSSPVVSNGAVYFGSGDGNVYAIDAASGSMKWKFKTGEDHEIHNQVGIQSSAAVVDGMVYFGCRDAHLYALNAATGEQKWALSENGSWVVGSPAVREGKVYFPTSDSSLLFEVDAETGKVLRSLAFNHWYLYSSPAIAGNTLYIGSTQGKLFAVGLGDLKPVWSYETDATKQHSAEYVKADGTPNGPALFHGDFYDDMVSGVERVMSMGAILSSPVVVENVIYVGSADGNLYALM